MESYNNDLTIHTDEVQTEVTRTWVFSVCRKLPEGGEFGRRRRSRAIRSILSSVNNQQPISVTVFGESSMKKLSEIIQDTIRRINNSGKYKESSENVDLNDCFIPEAYTYTLPEKLFFCFCRNIRWYQNTSPSTALLSSIFCKAPIDKQKIPATSRKSQRFTIKSSSCQFRR